jgi:DNA-binding transcriptional LysR family regulator
VSLTPAGEEVYRSAKMLSTVIKNLEHQLQLISLRRPVIRLGVIDSMASILFTVEGGFSQLKKDADISLVVNNSSQLIEGVIKENLDAAIIIKGYQEIPITLNAKFLGPEPLMLVANPKDKLKYLGLLRQHKLPDFLSYNIGSNSQYLITKALEDLGINSVPSFYSTSPDVMMKMVLLGQGVAILPLALVKDELISGKLASLSLSSKVLSRPIYAISHQQRLSLPVVDKALLNASGLLKKLSAEAAKFSN